MKALLFFILTSGNAQAQYNFQNYVVRVYNLDNIKSEIIVNNKEFQMFTNQNLDCMELDHKINSTFNFGGLVGTYKFKENGIVINYEKKRKTQRVMALSKQSFSNKY